MFSGLWTKVELSKFEKSELLTQPCQMIKKLRAKEIELKKIADANGCESKDYKKYEVIANLMLELNRAISQFNRAETESSALEAKAALYLVKKMHDIVQKTLKEQLEILMISRNNYRRNMNYFVYYGTMTSTLTAMPALTLTSLGKLVFLVGISTKISSKMVEITGLDDISPESFRLISSFAILLNDMLKSFIKTKTNVETSEDSVVEEYLCPINATLMEEPVLCTLDGHTYEKEAIDRWLFEHRNSPMTRKKMKDNEPIANVLITNRNLKSLIEKYNEKNLILENNADDTKENEDKKETLKL
jgi:hypothetical protein